MHRPRDLVGLFWAAARPRARWIAAVVGALVVGVAMGAAAVVGLTPERTSAPAETARAPRDAGAIDGVVLEDRGGLRAGRIVRVAARTLRPSSLIGDARFDEVLVGGEWVTGDAIALRSDALRSGEGEDPLRGGRLPRYPVVDLEGDGALDLDGDGALDGLWHATRESVEDESGLVRFDGHLVFEGSRGVRTVPLGGSDGWGTAEQLARAQLRDVVGTPALDLVVVLETHTCEVGPSGHRLVVVTFGSGAPVVVIAHDVNDPALIGLTQYEVGSVRVRGREIVARTVVSDPECARDSAEEDPCVHVRVDRWRGGVHDAREEPLRTLDGGVVTRVSGGPLGPDEPPPELFVVREGVGRWERDVPLAEEPYARALREWGTDALDWTRWVMLDDPEPAR